MYLILTYACRILCILAFTEVIKVIKLLTVSDYTHDSFLLVVNDSIFKTFSIVQNCTVRSENPLSLAFHSKKNDWHGCSS